MTPTKQMIEVHISKPGVTWRKDSIWMAGPLLAETSEVITFVWDGATIEVPCHDVIGSRRYHWESAADRGPVWQVKVYDD